METKTENRVKLPKVKPLEIGDLLEGTVILKKSQEIYVDLSPYGTGRLYGSFYLQNKELAQNLKVGERVGVKIVGLDDCYGNYEIVLEKISEVDKWHKILEYYRNKTILELEVKEANRGGLILELEDIKGFLPVSQLSPEYYPRVENNDKNLIFEHLKQFVGKKIKCRIASADPSKNKLIFSEKATKEEEYQKILSQLIPGEIMEVKVVGMSPFGLFVRFHENPAMDGLIHLSEIPEEKAEKLEENYKVGDVLKAKLIQIKQDKVNFSLIDLKPDPWVNFCRKFKEGDKVKGKIIEKKDVLAVAEIEEVKGVVFEKIENLETEKSYEFLIEQLKPREKTLILKPLID